MSAKNKNYSRILKSSSVIGGSQGLNMLFGIVRVKFVALFLGPTGLGILGMLQTIQKLATTVSGMGLSQSGVREVAEASGTSDSGRIGRTALTIRRLCWVMGIVGALLLVVFAETISLLSFGSKEYSIQIAWLSSAVLMSSAAAGEMVLIQGMRRVVDLAKVSIFSSIAGTVTAVVFYALMGIQGIVPVLVILAAVSLFCSFYFSRKIEIQKVQMTWRETLLNGGQLVSLGLAFMCTALVGVAVEYITRTMIAHQLDFAAVGIFTAAYSLSGMFLNFILGAMGTDFYPALTSVSSDHSKMRDLVNQQTEIGLLLATPGLLATMSLAPWIVDILYSETFGSAVSLLQWFVLGCVGRVLSWPMIFIVLAKGKGGLFALIETITHIVHLVFIFFGIRFVGVEGSAVAFACLYIFYTSLMLVVSRKMIGFRWSQEVTHLLLCIMPISVGVFFLVRLIEPVVSSSLGAVITLIVAWKCLKNLCQKLGDEHRVVRMCQKIPFLNLA